MSYLMDNQSPIDSPQQADHHEIRLDIEPVATPNTEMAKPSMPNPNGDGSSTTKFTCPVCYEEKGIGEAFDRLPCSHHFCTSCIRDYLKNKVDENKIMEIKCPYEGCTQVLSDEILKRILDAKIFENYKSHKDVKLLAKNPNIRYCPNPTCSKPFTPNKNKLTFCSCGTKICNSCIQVSHEGKPCEINPNEKLKAFLEENDIRHCLLCKTPAERNGGCLIMVCPMCDYHWCWKCGRHYEIGHEIICKRKWDPIHPNDEPKDFNAKMKKGCVKSLGVVAHVLSTLLMPFVTILFWPIMTIFKEMITLNKPIQFMGIVLANFALALITFPFTLVLVIATMIWHFCKYQIPWLIYCCTCKCYDDSNMYRWKRANGSQANIEYEQKHKFPHALALA